MRLPCTRTLRDVYELSAAHMGGLLRAGVVQRRAVLALAAAAALAACSRGDPKACTERIARLEQRLAGQPAEALELIASGFDVPQVSRERARPIAPDGVVIRMGFDDRATSIHGYGPYASFRGEPERGRPDVDVAKELARLLAEVPAQQLPAYVVVPTREHAVLDLVDVLAAVDPRVELRLVVGIAGTTVDPLPADAPSDLRAALAKLPNAYASERYSQIAAQVTRAIGECKALEKDVIELLEPSFEQGRARLLATVRACGCKTVDVPRLEAMLRMLFFNDGQPALGWVPLDLRTATGTAQQLANADAPARPAPAAGMGTACSTDRDCPETAPSCVPFDAQGTWHPTGSAVCTVRCSDGATGCPHGFRCSRQVAVTSAIHGKIEYGVLAHWCGPVAARPATP